jgi:hypothetical protein
MASSAALDIGIDRGVFVRGTPLWIGAERKKSHVIGTRLEDKLPPRHERLLTSIVGAGMLDRAGLQAGVLPATFRQWMGFGGRQVQLVELGSKAGEAGVLIDDGKRRTLVLSSLIPGVISLPPVDHLVVRSTGLDHQGPHLSDVLAGLAKQHGADKKVVLRVENLELGVACLDLLGEMGLPALGRGLLGRFIGKSKASAKGWAVAFAKDNLRGSDEEIWLDTGLGRFSGKTLTNVGYYGGFKALNEALQMTQSPALTLYDADRSLVIPESIERGIEVMIHYPHEKSMTLGFEALGSL